MTLSIWLYPSKHRFKKLCLAAGTALFVTSVMTTAAFAQNIPVRVGPHDHYTRMVFDFPRVTAYYADTTNGDMVLTFDTPATLTVPSAQSAQINKIESSRPDAATAKVVVDLKDGATFKHYRLMRKVIVDIYPPGKEAPTAAPAKIAEKKKEPPVTEKKTPVAAAPVALTAAATPAPKPVEEKPVIVTETPPPTPAPATTPEVKAAEETAAVEKLAAQLPEAEVSAAPLAESFDPPLGTPDAAPPPEEPTKISISTVSPTRLAVFTRYDTLWIVMDAEASGAMDPSVSGPVAGLLGSAKLFKFDGGTAFRYTLPARTNLKIVKKALAWDILLTRDKNQAAAKSILDVNFDATSKKAKLMAEMKSAGNVLTFEDPAIGDTLYVVPTSNEVERIEQGRRFTDVEIIPAAIGMVVRPLKDTIKVGKLGDFITVTSPEGIIATPGATAGPELVSADAADASASGRQTRLFDFPNWRMGGIKKFTENRRKIEKDLVDAKTPDARSETLLKLALLHFANNLGQETLGILRLIASEDEEMVKNPNFIALRGAASALAGHYPEALADLSTPAIQQHPEVNLWIGYAAAATEQWRMANRAFPKNNFLLTEYPQDIAAPFTIYMAESALRMGHADTANTLLQSLDSMSEKDDPRFSAAIDYLKGEAARQEGRIDDAEKLWIPVAHGLDRLYHAKASLALANLYATKKDHPLKESIDMIDNLRFAWRGDGLEVQILNNLGKLRVKNGQYLSGLQDMKTAAALADEIMDDSKPIRDEMNRIVADLFAQAPDAKRVSPLEAVAVYNEFNAAIPAGEPSTTAALNFTDYLISMDLLPKAEQILEAKLKDGVPDEKRSAVGGKLAALYLLDGKPAEAIAAIDKTGGEDDEARKLLKARAMSQQNRMDEAIALLSTLDTRDARKLKADVLWRARKWDSAAAAIENLLPADTKDMSDESARLITNAAVAYRLAGDDAGVASLKSRYGSSISATSMGPAFGVLSRDTGASELGDRESILKLAGEVDMFKGFLDSYKVAGGKGS